MSARPNRTPGETVGPTSTLALTDGETLRTLTLAPTDGSTWEVYEGSPPVWRGTVYAYTNNDDDTREFAARTSWEYGERDGFRDILDALHALLT